MGNSRARAVYEALLSDNFRRPQTDSGLESFIRSKYEQKKYIAREWIPPPPITKVDWDKEIEEELENQKRKKKSTSGSATIPEPTKPAPSPVNIAIPAPLPKPHSPKNSRLEAKKAAAAAAATSSNSMDLLGLDTSAPVPSTAAPAAVSSIPTTKATNDSFDFFANLSTTGIAAVPPVNNGTPKSNNNDSSLKQEEDDFFNQKSVENGAEKGKMTKDSILALYGSAPQVQPFTPPQVQPFNANFQQFPGAQQDQFFTYGQQPGAPLFKPAPQQQAFAPTGQPQMMFNNGNFGNFTANFPTMQTQQINKLNEENIKKIESLNFNNFK
jgi:stromal membrane-associated protein